MLSYFRPWFGAKKTPTNRPPVRLDVVQLEPREMFNASPWLANQVSALEGTTQPLPTRATLRPLTSDLLPETGLRAVTPAVTGDFTLNEQGVYEFSYAEAGTNAHGTYLFLETGYVTFALQEEGTLGLGTRTFPAVSLLETAGLSYSFYQTIGGVETLQSGQETTTLELTEAELDPRQPLLFAWQGLVAWLATQEELERATSGAVVTVSLSGSETLSFQETAVVSLTNGNVLEYSDEDIQSPNLASYAWSGLYSYAYTETNAGTFTLSGTGTFGGVTYTFGTLTWEASGSASYTLAQTGVQTSAGTGNGSYANLFVGNDHTLTAAQLGGSLFTSVDSYSWQERGQETWTLLERGTFSGTTLNLSTVNQQQLGTATATLSRTREQIATGLATNTGGALGTEDWGRTGDVNGTDMVSAASGLGHHLLNRVCPDRRPRHIGRRAIGADKSTQIQRCDREIASDAQAIWYYILAAVHSKDTVCQTHSPCRMGYRSTTSSAGVKRRRGATSGHARAMDVIVWRSCDARFGSPRHEVLSLKNRLMRRPGRNW